MRIQLNGEPCELPDGETVAGLLALRETLWTVTEARMLLEDPEDSDEERSAPIGFQVESDLDDDDHGQDIDYSKDLEAPRGR